MSLSLKNHLSSDNRHSVSFAGVAEALEKRALPLELTEIDGRVVAVIQPDANEPSKLRQMFLQMQAYATAFHLAKEEVSSKNGREVLYACHVSTGVGERVLLMLGSKDMALFPNRCVETVPVPLIDSEVFQKVSLRVKKELENLTGKSPYPSRQKFPMTCFVQMVAQIAAETHAPMRISSLDLGCGTDVMKPLLCRSFGWKTVSVESDPLCAKVWEEAVQEVPLLSRSFVQKDMREYLKKVIAKEKSFSLIYSINAIDFLPSIEEIETLFKDCFLALHPGGTVFIRVSTENNTLGKEDKARDAVPCYSLRKERYLNAAVRAGFEDIFYDTDTPEGSRSLYLTLKATKPK